MASPQQPRKKMPERMRRAYLRKKGASLSKREKAELWKMNLAMFGQNASNEQKDDSQEQINPQSNANKGIAERIEGNRTMADETKTPAPVSKSMIVYNNPDGTTVSIDPSLPKTYKDTKAYAEEQLWPDLPQKDMGDLFGVNVCLLDKRRMTKGKPGMPPYFAVLAATEKDGVFTFLSSGETVNRKLSKLFGIDSVTGESNGYRDETKNENGEIRGVWVTFMEREGGEYGHYFDITEPITVG